MPRIAILSDLHQEHWGAEFQMPQVDADLLVVAGDVMEPRFGDPVDWLLENTHPRTPVVFVPGNHDFFGGEIGKLLSHWRQQARGSHVHILYNEERSLAGLRVIGTTLWSGLALHRSPIQESGLRRELPRRVKDFQHIRHKNGKVWSVRAMLKEHQRCVEFLSSQLSKPDPFALVVTHWPAHRNSTSPAFTGGFLEPYFTNHYPDLVGRSGLWVHGHVHYPFDYRVGAQGSLGRVFCNPLGMPVEMDEWGQPLETNSAWRDRLYLDFDPRAVTSDPGHC